MGRFDPKPSAMAAAADVNPALVALLERLETGLRNSDASVSALAETVKRLALKVDQPSAAPVVRVSAPPAPEVNVTLASELPELLDDVARQIAQAMQARPDSRPDTPTVDLSPLHDSQEQVRLLLEKIEQEIGKAVGGQRSHFDGRLRDRNGQVDFPQVVGTYDYAAGTDGTPTIPARARILSITASGPTLAGSATVTIDGGDSITLPADTTWVANPEGNLVGPTVVFTDTRSYFVDWVV